MIFRMDTFSTAEAPAAPPLRERAEIPDRFKWDLSHIYPDWNAWQGRPLRRLGGDLWEGTLVLKRGLYHFNLLVDGNWVVPNGVATVPDGMGGMVAVLVVP